MSLTYAEFCAGYGGLGLAVEEAFGAELAWYSEFDAAPSKIMAHHWPDAPNHGDMTRIDFSKVAPVDLLSGGTPCQDLSTAGRRAGMRTGTRSGLWESMREAVATIKPKYVVWENVRGAYSADAASSLEHCPGCMGDPRDSKSVLRALGRVLGDLADLGYDAQWRGLRAADVGAPHGRYRVFILATRRDATDADGARLESTGHTGIIPEAPSSNRPAAIGTSQPAASKDTDVAAGHQRREPAPGQAESWRTRPDAGRRGGTPAADARDWAGYTPAIRRWEAVRGTAPAPTIQTDQGNHRLSARFAEWMMGLDDGWVTAVPGINRNDQLKALGNGVVPQQAAAALKDMLAHV